MSLKNIVGCTSRLDRLVLHAGPHIGSRIAELNLAWKPALSILDARLVFVSGGPDKGVATNPGILLASSDRVALDATGIALLKAFGCTSLKCSPWEQEQIKRAVELGLGARGPGELELKSRNVKRIKEIQENLGA